MRKVISTVALACAVTSVTFSDADSLNGDKWRFRSGLRNGQVSRRLSASELQMVLDSLRRETGFQEMGLDESGFITLGDRTRFAGGSASARELLIATVDGEQVFELEAHRHSPCIAFADLTPGSIHVSAQTHARIAVHQIRLDFADFAELRGSREAIAAFDLGFAVLHELVHGVLHLNDAVSERAQLGACDEHINRIRRELHLPERHGYAPRIQWLVTGASGPTTRRSELIFLRPGSESRGARTEWFYLYWNADSVAIDPSSVIGH